MQSDDLLSNPIEQFSQWFDLAKESEINDPGAMALATATPDGKPSVRMVLLKQADESGFKFHSNADSQKGQELEANKQAALCFYWKSLRKQVRIEGIVEIISDEEADKYFKTRPYKRKIGAWASHQSRKLENREHLENKIKELKKQYPDEKTIPRPENWIGYRLVPETIEFWLDNPDRLHDRFRYRRDSKNSKHWNITRLYP